MISVGDRVPDATLLRRTDDGTTERVDLGARLAGRKVILFAVPGAFTPSCSSKHLPSFIGAAAAFAARGFDEIICVSVNDTFVMKLWGEQSGASDAGITMLADPDSAFTRSMGLAYSNPDVGFYDRSRRYAMVVDDGVVMKLNLDEIGACALSTAETVLEDLAAV